MIDDGARLFVETEDDIWEILTQLLNKEFDADERDLDFSKATWMNFHLNYKGGVFQSALTPSVMAGIVEYQRALHQVVALLTKGDAKVTKLTDDEKQKFELVFAVSKGSTNLLADAQAIVETLTGKVFDGMSSTHKLICVLVFILAFFSYQGFEMYLDNNLETTRIEAQSERDQQLIDVIKKLTPSGESKTKVLENAADEVPQIDEIKAKAEDAYDNIIRTAGGVDTLTISGHTVDKATLERLTQITRRSGTKVTIKGLFTVSNVDTKKVANSFLVRFEEVNGNRIINANLADSIMSEKYQNTIQRATFSKKPIRLTIAATQIGDSYTKAKVIKAVSPRKLA